jgi:hypothetical protein
MDNDNLLNALGRFGLRRQGDHEYEQRDLKSRKYGDTHARKHAPLYWGAVRIAATADLRMETIRHRTQGGFPLIFVIPALGALFCCLHLSLCIVLFISPRLQTDAVIKGL